MSKKIEALVARAKALHPEHQDGLAEHLAPLFASPLGAEQMLRFAAKHHPEGAATALAVYERWCAQVERQILADDSIADQSLDALVRVALADDE